MNEKLSVFLLLSLGGDKPDLIVPAKDLPGWVITGGVQIPVVVFPLIAEFIRQSSGVDDIFDFVGVAIKRSARNGENSTVLLQP